MPKFKPFKKVKKGSPPPFKKGSPPKFQKGAPPQFPPKKGALPI
jgi:hypothetical protein